MRNKLISLIICIFYISATYGQQRYSADYISTTKNFITDWRKSKGFSKMMVVDSTIVDCYHADRVRTTIQRLRQTKVIYKGLNWSGQNKDYSNSVMLKNKEINYISEQIKINNFIWTADLLGNNTQINSSSNIHASNWSSPGNGYFEMSTPIFFRNNTMCIFYFGHHEGPQAGEGALSLYIKGETGWQLFGKLFKWVS